MQRCWVFLVLIAACSSDRGEFRPAKGASDYPPTKDAYRVQAVPEGCDRIGVVHADGDNAIEDLAATAARHGGTHYIVRLDISDPELVTNTVATGGRGFAVATSTSHVERNRHLAAHVYRCAE